MRKLYALGAVPLLWAGAVKGCVPPAPNAGQVACAQWKATQHSVFFEDARGCFVYVRGTNTVGVADKAVNGRPYCVRAWYSTGYVEQLCTADATSRLWKRYSPVIEAEVVSG